MFLSIKRFIDLLNSREKLHLAFLFFIGALSAISEVIVIGLIPSLTIVLAQPPDTQSPGTIFSDFYFGWQSTIEYDPQRTAIIVFVSAFMFASALRGATIILSAHVLKRIRHNLACRAYNVILKNADELERKFGVSEVGKIIGHDVGYVVNSVGLQIFNIFLYGTSSLLLILNLVLHDVSSALLICIIFFAYYSLFHVTTKAIYRSATKDILEANGKIFVQIHNAFLQAENIKIRGSEEFISSNFAKSSKMLATADRNGHILALIPKPVLELFFLIAALISLLLVDQAKFENLLSMSALYIMTAYRLLPAVQQVGAAVSEVRVSSATVGQISEMMKTSLLGAVERRSANLIDLNVLIHIVSLRARFEGSHTPLEIADGLKILRGKNYLIDGNSGVGKSSLLRFILGYEGPFEGDILYSADITVADKIPVALRKVGYVPQDVPILDANLSENFAWAIGSFVIDEERFVRCLDLVGLDGVLFQRTYNGFELRNDYNLTSLSGGERQRLGIAFAIYDDPLVLVLDEATNALDEEAQKVIFENLFREFREITFLVVSHDQSVKKFFSERIVVSRKRVFQIVN